MKTRRLYADTAHDHSMLTGAVLQGLGADKILTQWPKGRSYNDIATFRAPYTTSYFQSGSLLGLGAPPTTVPGAIDQSAPPDVKRFLLSGEPVSNLSNNVALPLNQIPRWGYGIAAVGALALSYVSYKRFKKAKGQGK
jgi:hypothetical protein